MARRKGIAMWIAGVTLAAVVGASAIWSPRRWGMYIDAMTEPVPVRFFGRVVDDAGNPVQAAEVYVRLAKPNWTYILGAKSVYTERKAVRVTGADGRFEVNEPSGVALYVDDILKPGLVLQHRRNEGSYYYSGAGANPRHEPDENHPVEFRMRPGNATPAHRR